MSSLNCLHLATMIVRKLSIQRFGPFYEPFTLEFDPRVTIITGANDAGKSSLLRAIEFALSDALMPDELANHDHVQDVSSPIAKDKSVSLETAIELTAGSDLQGNTSIKLTKGDNLLHTRCPARQVNSVFQRTTLKVLGINDGLRLKYPALVKPGTAADLLINSTIDLENPRPLEKALLDAGFRSTFQYAKFAEMSAHRWGVAVRMAEVELNQLLEKVLPRPGMVKFDLRGDFGGKRNHLGVLIRDRHDAITPFGDRGSGVRKMIGFLSELITYHRGAHHKLVLLDEPENSLHADAQHLLREFLFGLTADGRTQVIYATHSPAMLNPMRGEQVRVLYRDRSDDKQYATTRLLPRPEEANFHAVRTSLGISLGDSLVYAPVTVITEGITEVRCIPKVLLKLRDAGLLDGMEVEKLLGLATFLDGNGDSVEYLTRLAKAHGAKVILFLDGDKRERVQQLGMAEVHPDVSIVYVTGEREFEQVVPEASYLAAVAAKSEVAIGENAASEVLAWTEAQPNRKRMAFSKRVDAWFVEKHGTRLPSKKVLMEHAVDLTAAGQIDATPFRQLLGTIAAALKGTSFD